MFYRYNFINIKIYLCIYMREICMYMKHIYILYIKLLKIRIYHWCTFLHKGQSRSLCHLCFKGAPLSGTQDGCAQQEWDEMCCPPLSVCTRTSLQHRVLFLLLSHSYSTNIKLPYLLSDFKWFFLLPLPVFCLCLLLDTYQLFLKNFFSFFLFYNQADSNQHKAQRK